MQKTILGLAIATLSSCGPVEPKPPELLKASESPTLSVVPRAVDDHLIELKITTTLPTPVEVMAGVSLAGQKDNDIAIGYDERVTLSGPETIFMLDTSKTERPIPAGIYDAEVDFYPRWGAKNGNPGSASAPRLHASKQLKLDGSGEASKDVIKRLDMQKWVMGNIPANAPWNQANFESRLGSSRKGPSTMSHLHDAYYFPAADVTFLVNRLKNEATVWRLGDVTE